MKDLVKRPKELAQDVDEALGINPGPISELVEGCAPRDQRLPEQERRGGIVTKDDLQLNGFEIKKLACADGDRYFWSARFWVDDGQPCESESAAIDDCVANYPNLTLQ